MGPVMTPHRQLYVLIHTSIRILFFYGRLSLRHYMYTSCIRSNTLYYYKLQVYYYYYIHSNWPSYISFKVAAEHFQRKNVQRVLNSKAECCSCTACKKCRDHSFVQNQRTFGDNCSPDTIKHTGVPTCRCLHPDLGGIKRMAHQGHARPSDRTRQAWTQLAHEHNVKLLHRARGGHHCP